MKLKNTDSDFVEFVLRLGKCTASPAYNERIFSSFSFVHNTLKT